jgi:hypothetical protein
MPFSVRTVEYFYTRVDDKLGKAYELLAHLASEEINLVAFSAIPYGARQCELTLFPERPGDLEHIARKHGWALTGPQHAFLIQGDDRLGAFADIHRHLLDANVSIYASTGVTDGQGFYGYVIYVKEADFAAAAHALHSAIAVPA